MSSNFNFDKFGSLETFLRLNFPEDVLMPVRSGLKAPAFQHSGGVWTWDSWNRVKKDKSFSDACIVLKRLCVVDVDSECANDALLERFPIPLSTAPVEKTSRGYHYWFVRPEFADELGYYDGAAQREKGIDFKSVYSNGTGGIVVVSPGDGRSWVTERSIWEKTPFDIPLDLLDAVAVQKKLLVTCVMSCLDGELVEAKRSRLVTMASYFEPVVSGEFSAVSFPVPLKSCIARDLVSLIDSRILPDALGNDENHDIEKWVNEIAVAADIIGFPRAKLESTLNSELVLADYWARKVVPLQTRVLREETYSFSITGDSTLVEVPNLLEFEPLPNSTLMQWAFFSDLVKYPVSGEMFSISNPPGSTFAKSVPVQVAGLLDKHKNNLVAAGGFVMGAILNNVLPGSDVDLYIHSCDNDKADTILKEFLLTPGSTFVCATNNAVTLSMEPRGGGPPLAVQLIRCINKCRAQVLVFFDFPSCKVLARSLGNGTFIVECLPSFLESARNMAFAIDFSKWNTASSFRVLKYCAKGFTIILPGIGTETQSKPPKPQTKWDASVLLNAYSGILKSRRYLGFGKYKLASEENDPLTIADVYRAFKKFTDVQQSGYDEIVLSGRLKHALKQMHAKYFGRGHENNASERHALVPRLGAWIAPGEMSFTKPAKHGRLMSRIELRDVYSI